MGKFLQHSKQWLRRSVFAVALVASIHSGATFAAAIIIDNFSGTLGIGARSFAGNQSGGMGSAPTFAEAGGVGTISLAPVNSIVSGTLTYAPASGTVDLTGGGTNDQFLIEFSDVVSQVNIDGTQVSNLFITINTTSGTRTASFGVADGQSNMALPFTSFSGGGNLTAVTSVVLGFFSVSNTQDGTVGIDRVWVSPPAGAVPTPPVGSITGITPSPTAATTINFQLSFFNNATPPPTITGLTNSDITLSGTAGATTHNVTGSGSVYNIAVSGMTTSGTVIVTLGANTVQDLFSQFNVGTSVSPTVNYVIPPAFTNGPPPNTATIGAAYGAFTYAASGGTPITFSTFSGSLPTGLMISAAGAITGTPTTIGNFSGVTRASNGGGTANQNFSIAVSCPVLAVTPTSLTNPVQNQSYSQALGVTGSSTGTYTYAVTAGALPTGMTLAADGTLSGPATGTGVSNFTVTVSRAGPSVCTGARAYSVDVQPPPFINGVCGTANGVPSLLAPTTGQCSAGTFVAPVVTNAANFTWACDGINAGSTNAACAAPRQFTVTTTPPTNGTLNCTSPVTSGATSSCTATPSANFVIGTISGCGGTPSSSSPYTTGAVTADCAVSATFLPIVNGACGTVNSVPSLLAPTANFCTTGTALPVVTNASTFTWACNGANTGTNATCSAPRQFTVTATPPTNGTLNCTSPVTSGATTSCTATPSANFVIETISGCGGTASSSSPYTTGAITADCAVSATFLPIVNGACGTANSVPSLLAPAAGFCAAGTALPVVTNASTFTWACNGANTGTNAACSAPRQFTVTATPPTNGTLNCTSPVTSGATTSCTATPSANFAIGTISGCGGTASSSSPYTTGAITADCAVSATFVPIVNGACGSANGAPSLLAPTANFCTTGTAVPVVTNASTFTWACNGANTGTNAACSAPRQFAITATPPTNGTLNCTSPVTSGATSSCTATPSANFAIGTISGCGGTPSSSSPYTTGAITADCAVSATFLPIVNGACGTANSVPSLLAPTANFCTTGTALPVVTNASTFTWACNGANTGTNAACSAPRQFTVTATPPTNGTLNCTSPVTSGATTSCAATPSANFVIGTISGCGGTPSSSSPYTTGAITTDCAVSATFLPIVNGACGTANSVPSLLAPAAGFCAAGTALPVVTNASTFAWACSGANTGTNAACSAPRILPNFSGTTATGSGAASATFTGGGPTCTFDLAGTGFVAATAQPPGESSAPHGWFRFKLTGCAVGSTVRMSVTWPYLAGLNYQKYGPTAGSPSTSIFYTPTNLTIAGNVASFDVTDGALGDSDLLADGTIIDPSGPILTILEVPTVNARNLALLALLMLLAATAVGYRTRWSGRR